MIWPFHEEEVNYLKCFTFLMDKWKQNSDRTVRHRRRFQILIVALQMFVWRWGAKRLRANRLAILRDRNVPIFDILFAFGCIFITRHWLQSCNFSRLENMCIQSIKCVILIAKYKIFFLYFSKMHFILFYI